MTEKEITASVRGEVKDAGINARVRMAPGDKQSIQVFPPTYEGKFTYDEQKTIRQIAIDHNLTYVYGAPIDVNQEDVHGNGLTFYSGYKPAPLTKAVEDNAASFIADDEELDAADTITKMLEPELQRLRDSYGLLERVRARVSKG